MMMKNQRNTTTSLRVLQINLGHRAIAHDALMIWLEMQTSLWIVCLQEPYFGKKGVTRMPAKYGAYWMEEGNKMRRAAIIAPKEYKGYLVTQYSTLDRTVVRFDIYKVSIVSIYWGVEKTIEEIASGLLEEGRHKTHVICCMDSNAHHARWGSIEKKRRWKGKTRGLELVDRLDDNGYMICNNPPHPPTFVRDNSIINSSHIDITAVTAGIFNQIEGWHVSTDNFNSDHYSIKFEYKCEVENSRVTEVPVYIPWRKPNSHMKKVMMQTFRTCSKQFEWVNHVEDVDRIIEQHSEQIRKILNKIFKKDKKGKGERMYWWNDEVSKIYERMKRVRRRMRKYKYNNLKVEFNEIRKQFRKAVRQAKREAWQKFTTDATDPWDKLVKIVRATTTGKIQSRTLSDLEGRFASDMKETLWLLGRQFFPPPDVKQQLHLDVERVVDEWLGDIEQGPCITTAEFRKALGEMTVGTAPGMDLITNNVISILAKEGGLESKYIKLFNVCLRQKYFPQAWKKARIILIPKPATLPNSAKSFRPISLTSCFAKLFERIILSRLLHYLSLSSTMNENQHAYRKGASTQSALYEVFNVVQSALMKRGGGVCAVVFLDISGAFDCTWHSGILHKLLIYGVPPYLVDWIRSFLVGRVAYFNEANEEYEVRLDQGCPQGGVLSPMLWNVLFNDMLGLPVTERKDRQHWLKVIGYADDAAIVCKGKDVGSVSEALNEHLKKVKKWSEDNRVKFNPAKLAVLTISNKVVRPAAATVYYGNTLVHEVQVYKYLGLLVDRKLNWDCHIAEVLRKLSVITKSLQSLSRRSWGVSLDIYRVLFHAIFVPVMLYGIGIWGWKAAKRTVCDKFDKEIRRYGLMATRCRRSTPTTYIMNLLKVQPFLYTMQNEVLKVSINQFHVVQSKRRSVYENYQKKRKTREVPQNMDHYFFMLRRGMEGKLATTRCEEVSNVVRQQSNIHPSKWVATRIAVKEKVQAIAEGADKRGWVIFTDASASSYGIGWGFTAFRHGYCQMVNYGSLTESSVFMAEALAVLQAVRYVNTITGLGKKEEVEVRSDARGLVMTLGKFVHDDVILCMIKDELRKAGNNGKNIILRWVPGHCDVVGNDIADKLAKRGVDSRNITHMTGGKRDIDKIIRERGTAQKKNAWNNFESRHIKMLLPDVHTLQKFIKSSPSTALCQLVSGHTCLNDFVCSKLGLLRSAACECGAKNETVTHFLLQCPLYEQLRKEVWEDYRAEYEFVTSDWRKLNEFVIKTGRLNRSIKEEIEKRGESSGYLQNGSEECFL